MLRSLAVALLISLVHVTAAHASADEQVLPIKPYNIAEHYTKYEYRIPMRDGVSLFTAVYAPKDQSRRWPFLVHRTPYSAGVVEDDKLHYGVDFMPRRMQVSEELLRAGYIVVVQDVRGRYQSGGTFIEMTPHQDDKRAGQVDQSTDMHDTVEWLLTHIPNNNGKVGISGTSYPGFYTAASVIDSHPAIKAASPQAPIADLFMGDDAYHGGAFMLNANFDFMAAFQQQVTPTSLPKTWEEFDYGGNDAYAFFLPLLTLEHISARLNPTQRILWDPTVGHATYDAYWQSRNLTPHLKNIRAAVLTVGGWFDAEDLQGPFSIYHAIARQSPSTVNALVVGPWAHGGWGRFDGAALGNVQFASSTGATFRKEIELPFFEYYLKGVGKAPTAEATMFETGTNVWRHYDAWPPRGVQSRTLYFGAGGTLSFDAPNAPSETHDDYVSDPFKPVPYLSYPSTGVPQEFMAGDQRFAATRPDVLTYQSAPLESDVTLAGPIRPHLFVSTSGTDADFVVKLIDVYPMDYPTPKNDEERKDVPPPRIGMAGYQQLVRGEPLRGKFRHSFSQPEPFVPDQVEPIEFAMPDVNHTFRRGHRIMVQVQSSWFPLIDLNPQRFVDIPHAQPSDFQRATQRIYRDATHASGLRVGVLAQ
ncbi:MAG: CocE/NonD family hydrolase [Pseudomonadota bacterium]|nr:CocE/NonD family hydrolase [Pseudomonadota bacterium]